MDSLFASNLAVLNSIQAVFKDQAKDAASSRRTPFKIKVVPSFNVTTNRRKKPHPSTTGALASLST
ncbi:hypothetical protein [Thioalkalivibrio sp. HK1]|uniref:hypothetical protein n=1 Tax=Thioalkalivibrio sp. HK1 TaxID=1469245 RepID=UPI0018CC1EE2|nr:hypothetical protein [Thioalkalivibrio sp. HK1]